MLLHMAASFPLPPALSTPAPLQTVLANGADLHTRQRELVRASLFRLPRQGQLAAPPPALSAAAVEDVSATSSQAA